MSFNPFIVICVSSGIFWFHCGHSLCEVLLSCISNHNYLTSAKHPLICSSSGEIVSISIHPLEKYFHLEMQGFIVLLDSRTLLHIQLSNAFTIMCFCIIL